MADNRSSSSSTPGGSIFSKKVGGIPVWALCAAGVGGLLLWRNQNNSAAAAAASGSTSGATIPSIDSTYAGPPDAPGQPISISVSGPVTSTPTDPTSGYAPTKNGFTGGKTGTIYAFVGKDGGGLAKKLLAQGYSLYYKATPGATTLTRVTKANLHQIKPGTDLYRIGAEETHDSGSTSAAS